MRIRMGERDRDGLYNVQNWEDKFHFSPGSWSPSISPALVPPRVDLESVSGRDHRRDALLASLLFVLLPSGWPFCYPGVPLSPLRAWVLIISGEKEFSRLAREGE